MTPPPTLLSVVRLRALLAGVVAAMVAAMILLWPASPSGVVLYAAGDAAAGVARAFTRQTGVHVTVVRLFTGPMLTRIFAEGRRPRWTAAWFEGDMAAAALDQAGLLARGTTPAAAWTPIGRELLPKDGAWTPVGLGLAGVLLSSAAGGPSPSGAKPLGLTDPALSGAAYPELAGILSLSGGWPLGRGALEKIRDRGLDVVPTSPNLVEQVLDRQVRRALIQSSTAYFLASQNPDVRVRVPQTAFALPGVIVVSAGASALQRRDTDRFTRFVLSEAGQRVRLRGGRVDAYYWPVTNVETSSPSILPDLRTLNLVHLDPYRWGARQAEITDWFEAAVAGR